MFEPFSFKFFYSWKPELIMNEPRLLFELLSDLSEKCTRFWMNVGRFSNQPALVHNGCNKTDYVMCVSYLSSHWLNLINRYVICVHNFEYEEIKWMKTAAMLQWLHTSCPIPYLFMVLFLVLVLFVPYVKTHERLFYCSLQRVERKWITTWWHL